MSYACTVLPLPLPVGPRDTFCVSNASYNDLDLGRPKAISLCGNGVHVAHHILFYTWEQGSMVGFQYDCTLQATYGLQHILPDLIP